MDPQQTEVSQQFERFKAAFAKKDDNSCSELKVLPTKFTSLPPLFESSPNAAQELTIASSVWSEVSPRPVIHASQRKKSEKTDNKKSLASTSKSCVKPEVVGCVVQTKKSGGFTLDFESQPVTKETLSQELRTYLRLQYEFIKLRLEQFSMEEVCPEEKERQKKFLDKLKRSVNDSVREVLEDSKNEEKKLVTLVEEVKAGRRRTEEHIFRVKNEIEKAKKKQEKDAKKKKK